MIIDLISDTVTKPSKGMLDAMLTAKVGDDVFQMDPAVNEFQEKVAHLFGMEAALFFPSGTMANQTAIKLHTQPGDLVICDKYSHIYNYESGGVAFNSGVTCKLVDGNRGMFTANQIEEISAVQPQIYLPYTKLISVENTTNKGGGACWDFTELEKIKQIAAKNNLGFHLDGARLFNALVAKNETPKQYGKLFDTISICFSKGLGAPVGSVLLGNKRIMQKALRYRKLLGGGMRQVGFLAAACNYALDNNINRLAEDHQKAKEIGSVLQLLNYIAKVEPVETNIVIFYVDKKVGTEQFIEKMREKNILLTPMGEGKIRIVTHLDYTDTMHDILLKSLRDF
jgi:threonine aldolase